VIHLKRHARHVCACVNICVSHINSKKNKNIVKKSKQSEKYDNFFKKLENS
jgi:hypothetical protein